MLPAASWLRDLAGAWVFYSVLPAWPVLKPRFERIARFAPWIGLVLGGLQSLFWLILTHAHWPAAAAALLVIGLGACLTGG
ncbi:MAG TPA: adenosylcobinamide-GDP ribazoletransferase, partial [Prochlorococcaceae cyanobacterium Fu_MAG_72]|nr:adenosylcobinamide-GDP ribazoletransferase [Prochlorococcaceae cyanobacterium Fu_MAG_72]